MREADRHQDASIVTGAKLQKPLRKPDYLPAEKKVAVTPHASDQPRTRLSERPARPIHPPPSGDDGPAIALEPAVADVSVSTPLASVQTVSGQAVSGQASEFRDRVINWLHKNVPNSRLQHILRVEQMAAALAERHQVNVVQAAQAGLMHDLAKYFKPQRLLEMAQAEGLAIDPVEASNLHLLHAAVGAIVARDEFGIQDQAVLDAIRHHTLGSPGMSALSCVVFLADSLEPGRGDTPVLETLRHISQQDLYGAVWQTCDESLRHLIARSQQIHPRMVLTRNWALVMTDKKSLDKKPPDKKPPIKKPSPPHTA